MKVSKHLAYLKERDLVIVERHQNWMIYSLPKKRAGELEANLKCLQDCAQTIAEFKADLRKLRAMKKEICWIEEVCCGSPKKASCK